MYFKQLKAALLQSKSFKTEKISNQPIHSIEDTKYIQKIIDEERVKPLEVTREYVMKYEQKELQINEKLNESINRHIITLKNLRNNIETKNDTNIRINAYRNWKNEFKLKKTLVLNGKTLEEIEQTHTNSDIMN